MITLVEFWNISNFTLDSLAERRRGATRSPRHVHHRGRRVSGPGGRVRAQLRCELTMQIQAFLMKLRQRTVEAGPFLLRRPAISTTPPSSSLRRSSSLKTHQITYQINSHVVPHTNRQLETGD